MPTAFNRPIPQSQTIKAMVVDDSAVVRQVLVGVLNEAPGIEVIATAADPLLAIEKMRQQWPDVIVLDVEMPRMDGITFLRKIMSERPTPVVICSTLTEKGARVTMDALAAGAVAVVTKPRLGLKQFLTDSADGWWPPCAAPRAPTSNAWPHASLPRRWKPRSNTPPM